MNNEKITQLIRDHIPPEDQEETAYEVLRVANEAASNFMNDKINENARRDPQLMREYKVRLEEIRQGDIRAISKLKAEFRRKGLPIW